MTYAGAKHHARNIPLEKGDKVMLMQKSSTTKTPWNPNPFEIKKILKAKITAERDGDTRTRNDRDWKKIKERAQEPQQTNSGGKIKKEKEDSATRTKYNTRTNKKAQRYEGYHYNFNLSPRAPLPRIGEVGREEEDDEQAQPQPPPSTPTTTTTTSPKHPNGT